MNQALQLPALSQGIPGLLWPFRPEAAGARLARRLFESRIIPKTAPASEAREPIRAAQRYLEAWAKDQLGDLSHLDVLLQLELDPRLDETGQPIPGSTCARFRWFTSQFACEVGPALEALESVQQGLGQTTLTVIDLGAPHLIPTFTPWDTMGMAQNLYWQGEVNETLMLELEFENEAEREAARGEMVTLKDIDDCIPTWATKWPKSRMRLSRAALKQLAKSAKSPRVRSVCEIVMRLAALKFGSEFIPESDGNFIGYGPVLFWRRNDLTGRIFDDFMNYSYECEIEERCGEYEVDLDDPTAVEVWKRLMKPRFAGIRLLDALIAALTQANWNRIPRGLR